jgi:hypothetical protein
MIYVLSFAGYGLDLTDESSYLNWISNPWLYPVSATQYGFFYHPFYRLVGGDIALLRGLNLLLTVGLASLLGFAIFRISKDADKALDVGAAVVASLPFGFVSVLYVSNWLLTPNYNSLNLQGLLISAIALVLIGRSRGAAPWCWSVLGSYALLGAGGWMVFLAKPPSAILLAVVALIYLLAVRKLTIAGLITAISVSVILLSVTALAIDGSVRAFVVRISDAVALSSVMDPRYSAVRMLRFDKLTLSAAERWFIGGLAVFSGIAIMCSVAGSRACRVIARVLLAAALMTVPLVFAHFRWLMPSMWSDECALQILAVPLGVILALFGLRVRRRLSPPVAGWLPLAALFFALPYVFAFGTNGNYWSLAAHAGLFWVAAAIILMRAIYPAWQAPCTVLILVLLPFSISARILAVGMEYPYRQTQPVQRNDQVVEVGTGRVRLTLASDFANYVRRLQAIAREGGFQSGDPVIDLTGHYPGAPLVLGAISVGQAWMIGGYPGSAALAAVALRHVSCATIVDSWLLIEPDGPRKISQEVLGNYGLKFEPVGSLASPTGSYPQSYQQDLLRPIHDGMAATQSCVEKREEQSRLPKK